MASIRSSAATARAVITSKRPSTRSTFAHSIVTRFDSPRVLTVSRRNSTRRRRGSIRVIGPSVKSATTSPGSPAPEPMSAQEAPSTGSKRANWAGIQDVPFPNSLDRRGSNEVLLFRRRLQ